jgi:hypothetical protein
MYQELEGFYVVSPKAEGKSRSEKRAERVKLNSNRQGGAPLNADRHRTWTEFTKFYAKK